MKRIFTLFLTMLTVLCASASDYTFKVEVKGQDIYVTPSAQTEKFGVAIFDQEAIAVVEKKGLPFETEQQMLEAGEKLGLFDICDTKIDVYPATEFHDGEYTVIMAAYENKTSDNIVKIQVEKATVDVVPDDDVTFAFSCTGETFSITPSNNESEYAVFIASPDQVEYLTNHGTTEPLTYVGKWGVARATALKIGEAYTGKREFTTADVDKGFEINLNDRCVVVVFGVKTFMKSLKDGDFETYSNSTPVSYFIWNVGETTTAIDTIETPASSMGKTFKDGKFIINGNVLIDGTLVK